MRKILYKFFVDKLFLTISFFSNSFFLTLVFYLSTGDKVPVAYPLLLTIFVYSLLMIVEWYKYYGFHKNLPKSEDTVFFDINVLSNSQEEVIKIINNIHSNYIKQIEGIKIKEKEQKRFLSHLIHSLKSPVAVIDLIVEKSKEINDQQCLRNEFSSVEEENRRIHKYLEQILTILRLEDFSQDYISERVDLIADIKKVINNNKKKFIYNNLLPKIIYEGNDKRNIEVLSDSKWNQIMLEQIVSNAIKYSTNSNSKKIQFIITQENDKCFLTIKDEGVGIPEYDMKRIFEPFFTGTNGRKYNDSSGIGLYICSQIARKLGHQLKVDSRPGTGTEFTITYLTKM